LTGRKHLPRDGEAARDFTDNILIGAYDPDAVRFTPTRMNHHKN